jgi:hypothetical protein
VRERNVAARTLRVAVLENDGAKTNVHAVVSSKPAILSREH